MNLLLRATHFTQIITFSVLSLLKLRLSLSRKYSETPRFLSTSDYLCFLTHSLRSITFCLLVCYLLPLVHPN
jgi:hypothetical protein